MRTSCSEHWTPIMSVQEHESEYPALQRGRQCINTSISAQASPFPVRGIWSPTFHFFGRINWMSFSYRRTRQCFISTKAAAPKQSILPTSQWVYGKISSIFYPVSFNYSNIHYYLIASKQQAKLLEMREERINIKKPILVE